MKKLIVDVGNSSIKFAVFDGYTLLEQDAVPELNSKTLDSIVQRHGLLSTGIISSVRRHADVEHEKLLKQAVSKLYRVKELAYMPLVNKYETPHTLGDDRWAAAIGGHYLYPAENLLIVDAGTALTYEFVSAGGAYLGGSISPGIKLRFKSLHQGTGLLPLVEEHDSEQLIGRNTYEAIAFGVRNGVISELQGITGEYLLRYANLKIIFTGGDAFFLAGKLKTTIFVVQDLVLIGLNRLLEYNVGQE